MKILATTKDLQQATIHTSESSFASTSVSPPLLQQQASMTQLHGKDNYSASLQIYMLILGFESSNPMSSILTSSQAPRPLWIIKNTRSFLALALHPKKTRFQNNARCWLYSMSSTRVEIWCYN